MAEKPIQFQQQQQQQQQQQSHEALKCPRCHSPNTKFCYYNNYSLSQPRHFCKACKRYWTRGGTLRNVPVGGGCRKNKRVKRPITTIAQTNPNPNSNNILDPNPMIPSSTRNHHVNPLFYGLIPQNPNTNLDHYPGFDTAPRVSNYDLLQAQDTNASGLAFSSSGTAGNSSLMANHGRDSSLSFTSYMNMNMNSSIYGGGGSSSSAANAPTMASLLASSINQQQRFMGFGAYDGGPVVKDLKMEQIQNMREWNTNNFEDHRNKSDNRIEDVVSSDPNSILWDTGSGWLDPVNNVDSSVPSLI